MLIYIRVQKLVVRTKSVEYMPVYLSLASFANCVTWTCYAFLPYDPFILIPSALGIAFSVSQLILLQVHREADRGCPERSRDRPPFSGHGRKWKFP
ncbi:hypothetical protein SLA2020_194700 [Shorea laevis]